MGQATTAFPNRIVLIFDFDDTLAPTTINFFLESHGIDPEKFKQEHVAPWKSRIRSILRSVAILPIVTFLIIPAAFSRISDTTLPISCSGLVSQ